MSDCPKCCNAADQVTECDNDCGTFQCPDCETEWHLDVTDNAALLGHHPECGIESEVEDDGGNIEPMDLSE